MIDINGLRERLKGLGEMKDQQQKLQAARGLLAAVSMAEQEAARDFSISFDVVSRLREIIPAVQAAAGRAEKAERRRKELALAEQ